MQGGIVITTVLGTVRLQEYWLRR